MTPQESVTLTRDVEAAIVPVGTKVTLQQGEQAYITQALGGTYTVIVNGNMFRIDGRNADALGKDSAAPTSANAVAPASPEAVEQEAWNLMRMVYDPEIPVNIVDLGLVYDCHVTPKPVPDRPTQYRVDVKMTLTAPGCGMGPVLQEDVHNKILSIDNVEEAAVELVWDPPWNQGMMTEAAKLQLGLM